MRICTFFYLVYKCIYLSTCSTYVRDQTPYMDNNSNRSYNFVSSKTLYLVICYWSFNWELPNIKNPNKQHMLFFLVRCIWGKKLVRCLSPVNTLFPFSNIQTVLYGHLTNDCKYMDCQCNKRNMQMKGVPSCLTRILTLCLCMYKRVCVCPCVGVCVCVRRCRYTWWTDCSPVYSHPSVQYGLYQKQKQSF